MSVAQHSSLIGNTDTPHFQRVQTLHNRHLRLKSMAHGACVGQRSAQRPRSRQTTQGRQQVDCSYGVTCRFAHVCSHLGCTEQQSTDQLGTSGGQGRWHDDSGYSVHSHLQVKTWEKELQGDPDIAFLLEGMKSGFHIIDQGWHLKPSQSDNHHSAMDEQA